MRGQGLEQHIHAFQSSELADEHEVDGVVGQHRLVEFVPVKPMRHDAPGATRLTDQLDITIGGKHAFEQQPVGHGQQLALGHDVEPAHGVRRRIMQAAAMRRVDRLHLQAFALQLAAGKPRIGAALGAVAVQHIDAELAGEPGHLAGGDANRQSRSGATWGCG